MLVGLGVAYMPGEVVEIDEDEARRWIAAGYAEAARPERAPETATKRPRENTARRAGKPRS